MNQWWQLWSGHFSADACDQLIRLCCTVPAQDATVGYGGNPTSDNSVRRSKVRWLNRFDPKFAELFANLQHLFNQANKNAFGFDLSGFHEVQFTEYHAAESGKYDWHHDTHWADNVFAQRKASMVIQLSDAGSYEGGDLELLQEDCYHVPDKLALRQQGSVIVFPSFLRHRVVPVTQGVRYSLVTWCEGPCFR